VSALPTRTPVPVVTDPVARSGFLDHVPGRPWCVDILADDADDAGHEQNSVLFPDVTGDASTVTALFHAVANRVTSPETGRSQTFPLLDGPADADYISWNAVIHRGTERTPIQIRPGRRDPVTPVRTDRVRLDTTARGGETR
jgi:hypothetical protein